MIPPVLLSGIRYLERHFIFTMLSVGGLVIGLMAAIITFLWTSDELTHDRDQEAHDRIYLIVSRLHRFNGDIDPIESTSGLLAGFLKNEVADVEASTRTSYGVNVLFSNGKNKAYGEGHAADSTYFSVFDFNILEGNPARIMPNINSIVIAKSLAVKLFGDKPALGQTIHNNNNQSFEVTGVFQDTPRKSSLWSEFIVPLEYAEDPTVFKWNESDVVTYVKLKSADSKDAVGKIIQDKMNAENTGEHVDLIMFVMSDWWLRWSEVARAQGMGRMAYVIAFLISGAFILLMACINFMNLSTARAATRAKEIGVRKMSGATKRILIKQFLSESMLITFFSAVVAVLLVYAFLPLFNSLIDSRLKLDVTDPYIVSGIVSITIITGLVSGGYPAFLLSGLKPASILKGNVSSVFTGAELRRGLVVLQFTLSVVMIFCSLIIFQQISFLRDKDLGFDRSKVLYFEPETDFPTAAFKNEILRQPGLTSVGEAAALPLEINGITSLVWTLNGHRDSVDFANNTIDVGYLPTFGFKFIAGRNFSAQNAADSAACIITQEGADLLGFDDPIGQVIRYGDGYSKIIGVVNSFHNRDIHEGSQPVIFFLGSTDFGYWRTLFVRYEGESQDAIAKTEALFKKLYPDRPFEYHFVDELFESNFASDRLFGKLSFMLMIISIVIACVGLFGLTLFSTQRRTKEIGIRKALGATVSQLVVMLCKDFSRPIIISIVIALPLGWYLMNEFLQGFLFHTTLSMTPFIITIVSIITLGFATVSYQSFGAARKSPVEALKTE